MRKVKIAEELNAYMNSIDENFFVYTDSNDLILDYLEFPQVWFEGFNLNMCMIDIDTRYAKLFAEKSILHKFYMKAQELFEKYDRQEKYTIQIYPSKYGYLNQAPKFAFEFGISTADEDYGINTRFTQSEIEELKRREDLAIDWSKAKIEKVSDDDES